VDVKKGVRSQFRGMFDGMAERTRRDQAIIDAEEARDDAFRERSRAEADTAWRRLQHIMRGGKPSRDPNWNPDAPQLSPRTAMPGMLTVGGRKTPSELTEEAMPTFEDKTKRTLAPQEFLSAPVTDIERKILGLAPRGMLHQLNKQGLDRELDEMQQFHSLQRAKPKSM
jgi:hypothetical protein